MNIMVRIVYRGISIDEDNEELLVEMTEGAFPYFRDALSMQFTIWMNDSQVYCLLMSWNHKDGSEYDYFSYNEFYSLELRDDFMSAFQRLTGIPYTIVINHEVDYTHHTIEMSDDDEDDTQQDE